VIIHDGHAVLDGVEGGAPEHEPDEHSHWHDPQHVVHPAQQLQGEGNAAQLGGDGQHVQQYQHEEGAQPGREAEVLPHRLGDGLAGHRRESTGHLHEEDHEDGAEQQCPEELEAEMRTRLRCSHQIADVEEAADARDDAERELKCLLHGATSTWERSATMA